MWQHFRGDERGGKNKHRVRVNQGCQDSQPRPGRWSQAQQPAFRPRRREWRFPRAECLCTGPWECWERGPAAQSHTPDISRGRATVYEPPSSTLTKKNPLYSHQIRTYALYWLILDSFQKKKKREPEGRGSRRRPRAQAWPTRSAPSWSSSTECSWTTWVQKTARPARGANKQSAGGSSALCWSQSWFPRVILQIRFNLTLRGASRTRSFSIKTV